MQMSLFFYYQSGGVNFLFLNFQGAFCSCGPHLFSMLMTEVKEQLGG